MSMLKRLLMFLLLCFGMAWPTYADEFKPAYLQLTQIDAQTYDVLWKVPALNETTLLKVSPKFPLTTKRLGELHNSYDAGTVVQRWRIKIDTGLDNKAVQFSNLSSTRIDVIVRLARLDGSVQLERVLPGTPRFVAKSSPGTFEVVKTYSVLGIEHILTGFDHLLFVLSLLLLVNSTRRLVATITAFTVAHSITLAAAAIGFIHVAGPPVEACIAFSIVFVAAEIIHARQGNAGLTQRYPWLVAFTFGLLHGLGFASALSEIGLPPLSIPAALLFFNVGVEIGQLAFIATVLSVIALGRHALNHISYTLPAWSWRIPPYVIGGLASYWALERLAAF